MNTETSHENQVGVRQHWNRSLRSRLVLAKGMDLGGGFGIQRQVSEKHVEVRQ